MTALYLKTKMPSILLVSVLFIIGSYVYDSSVKNEVWFQYNPMHYYCYILIISYYHSSMLYFIRRKTWNGNLASMWTFLIPDHLSRLIDLYGPHDNSSNCFKRLHLFWGKNKENLKFSKRLFNYTLPCNSYFS